MGGGCGQAGQPQHVGSGVGIEQGRIEGSAEQAATGGVDLDGADPLEFVGIEPDLVVLCPRGRHPPSMHPPGIDTGVERRKLDRSAVPDSLRP